MTSSVLITGANRGIGLEFVRQYRDAGWEVTATARNPESAGDLEALKVDVHELDVTDEESVADLAEAVGGRPFDMVVNNAGIYGPRDRQGPDDIDYEGWLDTFEVNTLGPMLVAQSLKANLLAGEHRKLVNVTSRMGSIGDASGGSYIYRSSKAALNAAMKSLSTDWFDDGITVLLLHPGWVQTDMGGDSASLTPRESVRAMREIIDSSGPERSGHFLSWDGSTIPW